MGSKTDVGLGPSRTMKDEDKGLYFDPPLYMAASGIVFDYVDVINGATLSGGANFDATLMPWATRHTKAMKIRTSGYVGTVTVSGGGETLTIYNGLIVDVA